MYKDNDIFMSKLPSGVIHLVTQHPVLQLPIGRLLIATKQTMIRRQIGPRAVILKYLKANLLKKHTGVFKDVDFTRPIVSLLQNV